MQHLANKTASNACAINDGHHQDLDRKDCSLSIGTVIFIQRQILLNWIWLFIARVSTWRTQQVWENYNMQGLNKEKLDLVFSTTAP